MEQLSMFEEEKIHVPETVLSPLECKKKLGSKAFRANQLLFREYVRAIQLKYGDDWFEARKKFFQIRGTEEQI